MGRPSTARARLIASARELIHASNYGSASVDDLCTAAGVNKGSFYYFFPAKRDLALAVLDAQWAGAQESFLGPAFKPDVPPLERISRFFRKAAEAQRKPVVLGCPFGNLAIEMGSLDPLIRDRVAEILDGYRGYFAQALEEAVSSGDMQPLDVPAASQALVAYFQGAMLLAKTSNDAAVIERLGQQALKLVGATPPRPNHLLARKDRCMPDAMTAERDYTEVGPQLGTRFPDVVLPDQSGRPVDLHQARAGRQALIVFHRSAKW